MREARDARAHPEITEADLAAYYRDNGRKFQRPEQVRLRQILFRVDPADPATAGPAEAKARTPRWSGSAAASRSARWRAGSPRTNTA